jgi:alkyl sulfatase BDS1-like metallo-beta-lactamase superfamily hydrolase
LLKDPHEENALNIPDSFQPGESATATQGQIAHPRNISHGKRLQEHLFQVGAHAWSYVGNGLSNQSFIEGPEGLIVIDTGECVEEMRMALREVRQHTNKPIKACFYTHFHYVAGTSALYDEVSPDDLPIYGHSGIAANLIRFGGEVGPRVSRGLVHQFGNLLPESGPDGIIHVGLGRFFRNPAHAPYTPGYVPATHTFSEPREFSVAGLEVHFLPAPSDATDSVTIWFPELKLAVNNLLWPALFNIFAIRGEEYRDPRILLKGLDELTALEPDYLLGAHGPPLEGMSDINENLIQYRDAIQYIWDQTVRGANLGLSLDELIQFVQLPQHFKNHYVTEQFYGLVEHHVRQIYAGLFGWFDEDESKLFPVPAPERASKLIAGFGGPEVIRQEVRKAMSEQDYRWAVEMASWLVRSELDDIGRADAGEPKDRVLLAEALRAIAQSTTSANVRNWTLTRALELEGNLDLTRFRRHRFRVQDTFAAPLKQSVSVVRVLLVPERAEGYEAELTVTAEDGTSAGLMIRNQVAVPTDGKQGTLRLQINKKNWASLLAEKTSFAELSASGSVVCEPDEESVRRFLSCFDNPGLAG